MFLSELKIFDWFSPASLVGKMVERTESLVQMQDWYSPVA